MADQVGFDGLMINEHHSTPSCVNVGVNMTAAVLGRTTRRAKILILGNILPIEDNPVRMAEQLAMADLISGGRVLSGFVRGVGRGDVVVQLEPGPQPRALRGVPRPDLEVLDGAGPVPLGGPATITSATSIPGACRCRSRIRPSGFPAPRARRPRCGPAGAATRTCRSWCRSRSRGELFEFYRQGAAEVGRTVTPDNFGFLICAVTADTKEKAREAGKHFVWRMGPTLRGPAEWFSPVGMRSRAGPQFALKARPRSLATMSYDELLAAHFIIAGTPDEVIERFARVQRELGVGHLLLEAQESRMDHATTMRSIELMGAKVIPAIAKL